MHEQTLHENIDMVKTDVSALKTAQSDILSRLQRQEDTLLGEMRHSRRNNILFSGLDGVTEDNSERANMDAICNFLSKELGLGIADQTVNKPTFQNISECLKSKSINGQFTVLTCIPSAFLVKRMMHAWSEKREGINNARKLFDPPKPEIRVVKQKPQQYIDERNYLGKLLGKLKEQDIIATFDGIINNHPAIKIGNYRYCVIDLPDQFAQFMGRPFKAARTSGESSAGTSGTPIRGGRGRGRARGRFNRRRK